MAIFKSLRVKDKKYIFDFLGNRKDQNPAKVIFARFPLPDENFMPKAGAAIFENIDFIKLSKRDKPELEKLLSVFMLHFSANSVKIDYEAFLRECVDHFEDFKFDGKEIKTVDDFIALNPQVVAVIAGDCYKYAKTEDEFSMGE